MVPSWCQPLIMQGQQLFNLFVGLPEVLCCKLHAAALASHRVRAGKEVALLPNLDGVIVAQFLHFFRT